MIEIVNVDLETAFAKSTEKLVGDFVAHFGNNLKGGFDAEGVVQIHECATEVTPGGSLDIVRHCRATGVTVWPKPDKRDGLAGIGAYGAGHHFIEEMIHGLVDRPAGKTSLIPSAKSHTLHMFAYGGRQEGPHSVISFSTDNPSKRPAKNGHGTDVTLET